MRVYIDMQRCGKGNAMTKRGLNEFTNKRTHLVRYKDS